jgi:hypothetical protein
VVDETTRLPVRADFQLQDGRVARIVEWKAWRDRATLAPRTMAVKDVLRQDPPAQVEVVEFEARAVAPELFSLTDGTARAALGK